MKSRRISDALPDAVSASISRLGEDLSAARRARRMSQSDLAERIGVARTTIVRMEMGNSQVSIGAIAAAAWVLGLEKNLAEAFAPEKDKELLKTARLALPRKIQPSRVDDDAPDLDF